MCFSYFGIIWIDFFFFRPNLYDHYWILTILWIWALYLCVYVSYYVLKHTLIFIFKYFSKLLYYILKALIVVLCEWILELLMFLLDYITMLSIIPIFIYVYVQIILEIGILVILICFDFVAWYWHAGTFFFISVNYYHFFYLCCWTNLFFTMNFILDIWKEEYFDIRYGYLNDLILSLVTCYAGYILYLDFDLVHNLVWMIYGCFFGIFKYFFLKPEEEEKNQGFLLYWC